MVETAREAGLGVTIHVGEEGGDIGREEIGEVVESLRPDRIGHGILAAGDPELMAAIREREIVLEICPTSNLLTKALADEDAVRETFRRFVEHGVLFTIATDGPEMMRTHLRDEFELLLRIGALDEDEAREANARGHEAAFVGGRRVARAGVTVRNTPFGQWWFRRRGGKLAACRHPQRPADQPDAPTTPGRRTDRSGLFERRGRRATRHFASDREGSLRRAPAEARRPATASDSSRIPSAHGRRPARTRPRRGSDASGD